MELNITLFIQVINFFVAWFLLHVLYFKPAVAFLDYQEKEHKHLLEAASHWYTAITKKEHELDALWNKLKSFSKQHMPDNTHQDVSIFKFKLPIIAVPSLEQKEVDLLIHKVKQKVVQEVADVDL